VEILRGGRLSRNESNSLLRRTSGCVHKRASHWLGDFRNRGTFAAVASASGPESAALCLLASSIRHPDRIRSRSPHCRETTTSAPVDGTTDLLALALLWVCLYRSRARPLRGCYVVPTAAMGPPHPRRRAWFVRKREVRSILVAMPGTRAQRLAIGTSNTRSPTSIPLLGGGFSIAFLKGIDLERRGRAGIGVSESPKAADRAYTDTARGLAVAASESAGAAAGLAARRYARA